MVLQRQAGYFATLVLVILCKMVAVIRIGVPCDTYKITTKSEDSFVAQKDLWGIYKVDYNRKCNNRPTYRHVKKDRFLYVNNDGLWCIADSESIGDNKYGETCTTKCNGFNPLIPASNSPNITGWNIYSKRSGGWIADETMQVTCVCTLLHLSTCNQRAQFEVPDIIGRYASLSNHLCNNKIIYKHLEHDRYLYVDEKGKWMISNEDELHGVNRTISCSRFGYAYNPTNPAPEVPEKSGWKFFITKKNEWMDDPFMEVKCE